MSFEESSSHFKSFARKIGLARLKHWLYRVPKNKIQKSIREGGPYQQWKTACGKRRMLESARSLPSFDPPPQSAEKSLEVHYLTGKDYWYQTLYCFLSLQRFSDERITPVLHSDGPGSGPYLRKFRRVIPWAKIKTEQEAEKEVRKALPPDEYSLLHEWRHENPPLLRKIVDIHAGKSGWKLLLDSDMIFYRRPTLLVDWLKSPTFPCYMVDVSSYYAYSSQLRHELVDSPIPEAVNVGVLGLKSEDIDFDRIQHWLSVLLRREGARYPIDQPLCSLMLAGRNCAIMPPDDYVVFPSLEEGRFPESVLHHYVAESKRAYFQYGWRHVRQSLDERGISVTDTKNQ